MPAELHDAIDNAEDLLGDSLPHFISGQLASIEHTVGIASLYRQRGVAKMLTSGMVDPLFIGQIQSASAYAFGLARVPHEQQVVSKAASLWDAIGAQCWDAAEQIARLSRMSHDPAREHEDDFLYVAFVMQRYLLRPPAESPPAELEAHEQAQAQRLERWEEVLEGALDPRLSLCHALVDRDADAFAEAIVTTSEQRDEDLVTRHKREALSAEDMAWMQPVWPEGLALLRLAALEGMADPELVVPRVPPLLVVDNPYAYHPDAWRSLDFRPSRRA